MNKDEYAKLLAETRQKVLTRPPKGVTNGAHNMALFYKKTWLPSARKELEKERPEVGVLKRISNDFDRMEKATSIEQLQQEQPNG